MTSTQRAKWAPWPWRAQPSRFAAVKKIPSSRTTAPRALRRARRSSGRTCWSARASALTGTGPPSSGPLPARRRSTNTDVVHQPVAVIRKVEAIAKNQLQVAATE